MGRNVLLSAGSSLLAVVAFVVGVVVVATPYWAEFVDFTGEWPPGGVLGTTPRAVLSVHRPETATADGQGTLTAIGATGSVI